MKISEIMTQAAVTDSAEDTLTESCDKMRHAQTSSVLIINSWPPLAVFPMRPVRTA